LRTKKKSEIQKLAQILAVISRLMPKTTKCICIKRASLSKNKQMKMKSRKALCSKTIQTIVMGRQCDSQKIRAQYLLVQLRKSSNT